MVELNHLAPTYFGLSFTKTTLIHGVPSGESAFAAHRGLDLIRTQ